MWGYVHKPLESPVSRAKAGTSLAAAQDPQRTDQASKGLYWWGDARPVLSKVDPLVPKYRPLFWPRYVIKNSKPPRKQGPCTSDPFEQSITGPIGGHRAHRGPQGIPLGSGLGASEAGGLQLVPFVSMGAILGIVGLHVVSTEPVDGLSGVAVRCEVMSSRFYSVNGRDLLDPVISVEARASYHRYGSPAEHQQRPRISLMLHRVPKVWSALHGSPLQRD